MIKIEGWIKQILKYLPSSFLRWLVKLNQMWCAWVRQFFSLPHFISRSDTYHPLLPHAVHTLFNQIKQISHYQIIKEREKWVAKLGRVAQRKKEKERKKEESISREGEEWLMRMMRAKVFFDSFESKIFLSHLKKKSEWKKNQSLKCLSASLCQVFSLALNQNFWS